VRDLRARGYRLSVASNKPAEFSEQIVEELGIRATFDAVRGPEASVPPKPEPAMILACLDAMGVPPREAVYVGDMVLDVESAARAGVAAILVCGGSSAERELRATGQRVVASLPEILRLLPARPAPPCSPPTPGV
jgi:phosphoglycolate phosphatase